jgi:hypothetical protein
MKNTLVYGNDIRSSFAPNSELHEVHIFDCDRSSTNPTKLLADSPVFRYEDAVAIPSSGSHPVRRQPEQQTICGSLYCCTSIDCEILATVIDALSEQPNENFHQMTCLSAIKRHCICSAWRHDVKPSGSQCGKGKREGRSTLCRSSSKYSCSFQTRQTIEPIKHVAPKGADGKFLGRTDVTGQLIRVLVARKEVLRQSLRSAKTSLGSSTLKPKPIIGGAHILQIAGGRLLPLVFEAYPG